MPSGSKENSRNDLISRIKNEVTIPDYFNKVIIPSMSDYYRGMEGELENVHKTLCPLHGGEDTPSFFWREDRNAFKCFGCGRGGSVIDLHMQFQQIENGIDVSFSEAIKFFENVFLRHMDVESVQVNTKVNGKANKVDKEKFYYMNVLYCGLMKKVMGLQDTDRKISLLYRIRSIHEVSTANYEVIDNCIKELMQIEKSLTV